jgi:hypothetical protein
MTPRQRLWLVTVLLAGLVMLLLHLAGSGLLGLMAVVALAALVIVGAPRLLIAAAERTHEAAQRQTWKTEEGHHHNFAGTTVAVHDDGRHVWMDGESLKRVLHRHEADDVLAARISGKWRIDERQRLWLRVDAVVEHLSAFPGRMDPRVQKLRRWLERDVLFPADQRHQRQRQSH